MTFKLQNWITFNFDWKSSLFFFLAFILFTSIGTVSHETGHYLIAQEYFKNPSIHYGSVSYGEWKKHQETKEWISHHSDSTGYVAKEHYAQFKKYPDLRRKHSFYSTLGGPIQTILFGTTGFLLLYFKKKKVFRIRDWLAVFLAYFWSREVYIFLILGVKYLFTSNVTKGNDEVKMAQYLELPLMLPAVILGILGLLVLIYVTFFKIPIDKRFTFIISGIMGSVCGFVLWMDILGPILMP